MSMAASAPISTKQQGGFDLVAFAAIVVTILSWASSFVVIRICLGPLTPIELATARYVAAGAIALVYLVIYRPMPEKRDFSASPLPPCSSSPPMRFC